VFPRAFCEVRLGENWHHRGALPGRDNAILLEPTSSHPNCLKTRTLRSSSPTILTPMFVLEAVLSG